MTELELITKLYRRMLYLEQHWQDTLTEVQLSIDTHDFVIMEFAKLDDAVRQVFGPDWTWACKTIANITKVYVYR